jgi:TonB family protein
MEKIVGYFLVANVLIAIHGIFFRFLLLRQRRFLVNRMILLGGCILSLLVPLLQFQMLPNSIPVTNLLWQLPEVIVGDSESGTTNNWQISETILLVYGSVVGCLLFRLFWKYIQVSLMIREGRKELNGTQVFVFHPKINGPASFFGYIFWNDALNKDAEGAAVALAHERCHCQQLHSLDLLGMELLSAVFWINPAVYLLKRDLRQTHEFLADAAALAVAGPEGIKRLLLATQFQLQGLSQANHFHSHLKSRKMMLTQNSKTKIWPYLLVLPLAMLMLASARIQPLSESTGNVPHEEWAEAALPSGEVDVMPEPLNLADVVQRIGYPADAKAQKIEGKVIVKVLVDKKGDVSKHEILKEGHALLRSAVVSHLNELKFKPGTTDGKTVKAWVTIPFQFKLTANQ